MNHRQRQRGRFGGAVLLTSLGALGTGLTADAGASADVAVEQRRAGHRFDRNRHRRQRAGVAVSTP